MKNLIRTLIKIVVSIVLLYLVFTTLNTENFLGTLRRLNLGYLLIAFILVLLSKYIAHKRLLFLFSKIDIQIKASDHWKLYLQGMFYNLFLPGGIGGDAYKGYAIQKFAHAPIKRIIGCMVVDRLSGMYGLALYFLAFITLSLENYRSLLSLDLPVWAGVLTTALIAVIGTAFGYLLLRTLFPYLLKGIEQSVYRSIVLQGLQIVAAYLLLLGLGLQSNTFDYLTLFTVSSIVSVLPITLGGIGAREVTFYYGADLLHINSDGAVALSIAFFVVNALVSLIGIYFHYKKPTLRKPD